MDAPAIILSHGTGGLGAARALGRRGIRVTAIAYDDSDPILNSRFPQKKFLVSGSDAEKEAQILEILSDLPTEGAAILTNSDRLVELMLEQEEKLLGKYRYRLPEPETLAALNDKKRETQLIASLGFDIPKTIQSLPHDPDELTKQLRFPIIFKPHLFSADKYFPKKNEVVNDLESLYEFYRQWAAAIPHLIAQEVIPGPDSYSWVGSCTFDQNHQMLDCGVKQKLRGYPAHFGGSTYAVSRDNQEIVDLTRSLGHKLRYVGHAGIEFRWDDRDKCYKYIEINPRLPANVGFDEACGLPTVWNSYKIALGENVSSSGVTQRNGVYFLDLKFDLLSLRNDKTSLLKIATGYLALLPKRRNGMYFSWDDPQPALSLASRSVRGAVKFVARKLGFGTSQPIRTLKD